MSDSKTTLQVLKNITRDFCEEREWDQFHAVKDLAIGAVTESSELLEIFRFQTEASCEEMMTQPLSRQAIADELADVLFFVLRLSEKYNFDLAEAFAQKLKKNAEKYPVEKSKGSNKKYDQL